MPTMGKKELMRKLKKARNKLHPETSVITCMYGIMDCDRHLFAFTNKSQNYITNKRQNALRIFT